MLQKEFRYVLPLSLDEYQRAESWGTVQEYVDNKNDEGIRLIEKRPFENENEKGVYFRSIYHYPSHLPTVIRKLMKKFFPDKSVDMHEESWYSFPRTHSIYYNPDYFQNVLKFHIDTVVLPDLGTTENVHNLPESQWKKVKVQLMDIAGDSQCPNEFAAGYNPLSCSSKKTSRCPINPIWLEETRNTIGKATDNNSNISPELKYVCAYKLVSCEFKWWGLQNLVQDTLVNSDGPTMLAFHQKLFCCMDEWIDLTMEDINKVMDEKLC